MTDTLINTKVMMSGSGNAVFSLGDPKEGMVGEGSLESRGSRRLRGGGMGTGGGETTMGGVVVDAKSPLGILMTEK